MSTPTTRPQPDSHDAPCRERGRVCGADIELGNFIRGRSTPHGSGHEASRRLLEQIDGVSAVRPQQWGWAGWSQAGARNDPTASSFDSQDHGRRYSPANGACVYIDLNHLEICIPEVTSAFDHTAAVHAMLRVVRGARERANAALPAGERIEVVVNNSDRRSHSYGSHLSFLVSRQAWDDIFVRKLHYALFLASHQLSSMIFTGQGKVGAENGHRWVDYQISQRADFIEALTGLQTTYHRPIVNSRDEALCGRRITRDRPEDEDAGSAGDRLARLHCISYDNTLCHVASMLRVGTMQIVLAMIEADTVDRGLLLEDPVGAATAWSHDPSLRARAALLSGRTITAVDMQRRILEGARRFAAGGGLDGVVPRADEILDLWGDTVEKLAGGPIEEAAGRVDWVLKRLMLERRVGRGAGSGWRSPQITLLDQMYSSIDADLGLYWVQERAGIVERVVDDTEIERFLHEPPADTRAWTRAMLLRNLDRASVRRVDWDEIVLDLHDGRGGVREVIVELDDPRRFGRLESHAHFARGAGLARLLADLGARVRSPTGTVSRHQGNARRYH